MYNVNPLQTFESISPPLLEHLLVLDTPLQTLTRVNQSAQTNLVVNLNLSLGLLDLTNSTET
jgi:hypothetical protein